MRHLRLAIAAASLTLSLAGCAELQKVETTISNAVGVVASTSPRPPTHFFRPDRTAAFPLAGLGSGPPPSSSAFNCSSAADQYAFTWPTSFSLFSFRRSIVTWLLSDPFG